MPWSLALGGMVFWVAVTVGCAGRGDSPAAKTSDKTSPVGTASAANPVVSSNAVSTSTIAAAPSGSPFWPRFHGPKGDNLSPDTGLLKEWPKSGPPLVWTAKGLGHGYASVTLANGLIYTAGNLDEKTVVTALDLDGKPRWQADNGPAWTRDHPGTRGTPTIDGDRVYHESPLGELTCYDAQSGKKIWGLNILQEFGGQNITWALAESVLIDGDRLICCPGGDKASVAALDKRTGKTVWASPPLDHESSFCSPVMVEHGRTRMIVTMTDRAVVAFAPADGRIIWRHPYQNQRQNHPISPIYSNGMLYVTSGYGKGAIGLRLADDGRSVKQVWEQPSQDPVHGQAVLVDGYVYASSHQSIGGKWSCVEFATGKLMWQDACVGKGGSVVFADGMLYCYSETGVVGLVRPSSRQCHLVSTFKVPLGDGSHWAHPVVSNGRLFIRHGNVLMCYAVSARAGGS